MEIHKAKLKKSYLFFLALLTASLVERIFFDLGPNVELISASMLLASFYLGRRWGMWLVFLVMALSDTILGTTSIFIFTWSGLLIPVLISSRLFERNKDLEGLRRVFLGSEAGIFSSLFFYLWTNLGVWLLDVWGMYSKDFSGLLNCYINGLPFLRIHLLSSFCFATLGFGVMESLRFGAYNLKRYRTLFYLLNRKLKTY